MVYFPKEVMTHILSYNDTRVMRAERRKMLIPITDANELNRLIKEELNTFCLYKNIFPYGSIPRFLERYNTYQYPDFKVLGEMLQKQSKDQLLIQTFRNTYNNRTDFGRGRLKAINDNRYSDRLNIFGAPRLTPLNVITIPDLIQYCKDNGIKGYSKKKKKELYNYILKQEH
mgnify:CR=1 FL=1